MTQRDTGFRGALYSTSLRRRFRSASLRVSQRRAQIGRLRINVTRRVTGVVQFQLKVDISVIISDNVRLHSFRPLYCF